MDTQTDCLSYFLNNKLNIMIEHLGVSLRAAAGRAGVNQARFAVLTMRLSSLTRPAVAGLFQAFGFARTIPHPGTRFPPTFSLRDYEEGRSRAAHSDLWPEMSRRAL